MRLSLCSALLLSQLLAAVGAEDTSQAHVSEGLISEHVQYLASDELGGRGVGTEGIEKAAEYIASKYAEYGLIPGGDEGSYFQSLEVAGAVVEAELVIVGHPIAAVREKDFTLRSTVAEQMSFEGPLIFVGFGITYPEEHHDDYAGLDVHGKTLLMLRREPRHWRQDTEGEWTAHAAFAAKAQLAHDHGAVAVLFVNPPIDQEDQLTDTDPSEKSPLPLLHITREMANILLVLGGAPDLRTVHDWITGGGHFSGPLGGVVVRGRVSCDRRKFPTRNVIGILPGGGPLASEYVVFGAHYDHLGTVPPRGRPVIGHRGGGAGDEIHNGADDNASGTAGVIELARIYASGPPPKRSLAFMAFTGEEANLLGSRHFVDHPTISIENTVAMVNMDMIGRLETDELEVFGTKTGEEFEPILLRRAQDMNLKLKLSEGGTGPSDHTSFFGKEVPVLFLFTGLHGDYHRPGDDSEKVDYAGMTRVLEYARAVANDIIVMDQRPTFKPVAGRNERSTLTVRMGIMPASYGEPENGVEGFEVGSVMADGSAARAGMKNADRILTIDGMRIRDINDYMNSLKDKEPGDRVSVEVLRAGEKITMEVRLQGR